MTESDLLDDRRYSPARVAPLSEVSPPTVRRWCRLRLIRSVRLPGGTRYRILGADVRAMLRAMETPVPRRGSGGSLAVRDRRAMADLERLCKVAG